MQSGSVKTNVEPKSGEGTASNAEAIGCIVLFLAIISIPIVAYKYYTSPRQRADRHISELLDKALEKDVDQCRDGTFIYSWGYHLPGAKNCIEDQNYLTRKFYEDRRDEDLKTWIRHYECTDRDTAEEARRCFSDN